MFYHYHLTAHKLKQYYKVNSHLEVIIEVAQGLATFVGGILAERSFAYCYIATVVIVGISLLPCILFEEPVLENSRKQDKVTWKEHFIISFLFLSCLLSLLSYI